MLSNSRATGSAVALAMLGLVGCSANHHSIYRNQLLGAPSLTLVDAKQRGIVAAPPVGDDGRPQLVVCAEPSPDVFTVLAQAASATGSFGQQADPKSIQAAASAAYSSAEQGSSLARTQTINMLREAMYRTCERYLNGAITPAEIPIQAMRDQRMMVSTLAIEQLTAAATPRVVVIGASGSGAAGATATDAVVKIAEARTKVVESAGKQVAAAKKKEDTKVGCEANAAAIKALAEGTKPTADQTAKQTDCKAADDAATATDGEAKSARSYYDALTAASIQSGGGPASTTTGVLEVAGGGGDIHDAPIKAVAEAVRSIVASTFDQDEFLMLCLKARTPGQTQDELLRDKCGLYLSAKIDAEKAAAEAAREGSKAQEVVAIAAQENAKADLAEAEHRQLLVQRAIVGEIGTRFDKFWLKVSPANGPGADPAKVAEVIDAYLEAHPKSARAAELRAMKGLANRQAMGTAFKNLPTQTQIDLSK